MKGVKKILQTSHLVRSLPFFEDIEKILTVEAISQYERDADFHFLMNVLHKVTICLHLYDFTLSEALTKPTRKQNQDLNKIVELMSSLQSIKHFLIDTHHEKVKKQKNVVILLEIQKRLNLNFKQMLFLEYIYLGFMYEENFRTFMKLAKPTNKNWTGKTKRKQKGQLLWKFFMKETTKRTKKYVYSKVNLPIKSNDHNNFLQTPLLLASFVGMNINEMENFLNRLAEKTETKIVNYSFNNMICDMEEEIMIAISGSKLSNEQLMNINRTVVYDILNEVDPDTTEKTKKDDKEHLTELKIFDTDLDLYDFISSEIKEEKNEIIKPNGKELEIEKINEKEKDEEKEKEKEQETEKEDQDNKDKDKDNEIKPYENDFEYLKDYFLWIESVVKNTRNKIVQKQMNRFSHQSDHDKYVRISENEERMRGEKIKKRLKLTKQLAKQIEEQLKLKKNTNGNHRKGWIPRIERLKNKMNLSKFEINLIIFLVGAQIYDNLLHYNVYVFEDNLKMNGIALDKKIKIWKERDNKIKRGLVKRAVSVSSILDCFCSNFKEKIETRKYFYKSAPLIRDGIIKFWGVNSNSDLQNCYVSIETRILDFVVGLDFQNEEVLQGSHIYHSTENIDRVILPEKQKSLIINSTMNFENFKKVRKKLNYDEIIGQNSGVVLLFYGPSGTGKTMMANALAAKLKKKIMLVDYTKLGIFSAEETLNFIFKEAKIQQTILFFDECESLFKRKNSDHLLNLLLTEIERFDQICIFATNRPFDLDEAMHRRVNLSIKFERPDCFIREKIWKTHLPESLKLDKDVDLKYLANRYELTGGLIKNAVLTALSLLVGNNTEISDLVMKQKYLEKGAQLQLKGRLKMTQFSRRVVPKSGFDQLFLEKKTINDLKEIVDSEKARKILINWGFDQKLGYGNGVSILLLGDSGTGKTSVSKAIGFECGKNIKLVNVAELLSKYIGETTKNIESLFEEAEKKEYILVFEEAEGLFGKRNAKNNGSSGNRYQNIDLGLLLYHIEHYSSIVILISSYPEKIDNAFFRRFKYQIELKKPTFEIRKQMWMEWIPKKFPKKGVFDWDYLAAEYPISGGEIRNAINHSLEKVALKKVDQFLTMKDLISSVKREMLKLKDKYLVYYKHF
ncbi:atpase [Anaeramoeba flamelloides]|uniref:Atpase n=1 Tax=Anaeramoeba flamelloides TaxID=1746091 RepID=A0AAV7ZUU2_9EUKA|nr:atpase [Anaeramoeba flamelloides]